MNYLMVFFGNDECWSWPSTSVIFLLNPSTKFMDSHIKRHTKKSIALGHGNSAQTCQLYWLFHTSPNLVNRIATWQNTDWWSNSILYCNPSIFLESVFYPHSVSSSLDKEMFQKQAGRKFFSVILCWNCASPLKVTNHKADYMSALQNNQ